MTPPIRASRWRRAFSRPLARAATGFLALVALCAVYAPLVASGHPLAMTDAATGERSFPLLAHLSSLDILLATTVTLGLLWVALPGKASRRDKAVSSLMVIAVAVFTAAVANGFAEATYRRDAAPWMRELAFVPFAVSLLAALLACTIALLAVRSRWPASRQGALVLIAIAGAFLCTWRWTTPPETYPYEAQRRAGEVTLTSTLVPFSPAQRPTDRNERLLPPMTRTIVANDDATTHTYPAHLLGTDEDGRDVLSQLIHACRVALTVGFVATGVAFSVGVLLGALMGYFGGWVDTVLMRLVEVFMSLPVLFVLIVAAGIFPRSVLTMAALIGLFSWQSVARLVRAEFLALREADFVSAARAQGVPRSSVLFRHLLPNGVASAIVDASFTVSAAILAEAVLSYLGFGPVDRASWGRLLAQAVSETGGLVPHLAFIPGLMIFATVLSANAIGTAANEALNPNAEAGP
ncbi:MAG: ABC transporter permease [Phycisphaerales bacterium]